MRTVPRQLDPGHPWLRVKDNREELGKFLASYGVKIEDVRVVFFYRNKFEVQIILRDANGRPQVDESHRYPLTRAETHLYRPDATPNITREAYNHG